MWHFPEGLLRPARQKHAAQIESAVHLLDTMLETSEREIGALAGEFEKLAADVDRVLDLTSGIVTCVEGVCAQSIVPVARALGGVAGEFTAERLGSASGIVEALTNEVLLLKRLSALTRSQRSIAREMQSLGTLANIEVARLGLEGERFHNMARELHEFSVFVAAEAEDVEQHTADRQSKLSTRQSHVNDSVERIKRHSLVIAAAFEEALAAVDGAVGDLTAMPAQLREYVAQVAERIAGVVAAIQTRDMTRQQVEHVRNALAELTAGAGSGSLPGEASHAAILSVQKMQLECARESSEAWLEAIESCLDALLHIGSGALLGLGAKILDQEHRLGAKLQQMEELERDARIDDAGIERSLEGLGELSQIVRLHLEQCETARLRMLLLNLNSIIEACHFGDRAAAVLEIAGQISRVAGEWSELIGESSCAITEALNGSEQAEQRTRAVARATSEKLQRAQQQSRTGLAHIRHAADTAVESGGQIQSIVAALQGHAPQVRAAAKGVKDSTRLIAEAVAQIEQLQPQWGSYDPLAPPGFDRAELENHLSANYTAELERQVLQVALYGGSAPSAAAANAGNEIELF